MENTSEPKKIVVVTSQKSLVASILLTLFFGPLGLFYSSVTGGVVMLILSIIVSIFTLGFGLLITFPICIIWGVIATNQYNSKINNSKY